MHSHTPHIMLAYEQAFALAREHLDAQQPPVDWHWVLREGKRVTEGWFFSYELQKVSFFNNPNGARFDQAPGFLVLDDTRIRTINWSEVMGSAEFKVQSAE